MPWRCESCGHKVSAVEDFFTHWSNLETVSGHFFVECEGTTIQTGAIKMTPTMLQILREAIYHKYALWDLLEMAEAVAFEGPGSAQTPQIAEAAIEDLASRAVSPLNAMETDAGIIGRVVFPTIFGSIQPRTLRRRADKGLKKKKKLLVAPLKTPPTTSKQESDQERSAVEFPDSALAQAMRFSQPTYSEASLRRMASQLRPINAVDESPF